MFILLTAPHSIHSFSFFFSFFGWVGGGGVFCAMQSEYLTHVSSAQNKGGLQIGKCLVIQIGDMFA